VVLYHYSLFGHPAYLYETIGNFGWTGVDLFFVLSGYLIGGQLLSKVARNQPVEYGTFYFKRFLRIIPAYLAVLTLYFTIPAFKERSELPPLWRFLTFTQNFGLDMQHTAAFSHAWSLCIEEQFYLVLPLFIIVLAALSRSTAPVAPDSPIPVPQAATPAPRKTPAAIWLLPGIFILGLAVRLFNWYHFIAPTLLPDHEGFGVAYYKWIYYFTFSRLDGLLAGVTLAAIFHFYPKSWQGLTRHGNRILLLGLLLIAFAWWFMFEDRQYSFSGAIAGYPLISLAYGVLVLAALSPSCILYRYSSRFTTLIATLSYAIYLVHKQLIHLAHVAAHHYGFGDDSYALFAVCIVMSLLGGWLLHLVIERPFLRLRDKWLSRSRPALKMAPASPTTPSAAPSASSSVVGDAPSPLP
jgi:peptidoglycan/LPS O-acetylase OafA/YrhL